MKVWEWMGPTNTTFMEMASCALKSNGATEQGLGEGERRRKRRACLQLPLSARFRLAAQVAPEG